MGFYRRFWNNLIFSINSNTISYFVNYDFSNNKWSNYKYNFRNNYINEAKNKFQKFFKNCNGYEFYFHDKYGGCNEFNRLYFYWWSNFKLVDYPLDAYRWIRYTLALQLLET